MGLQENQSEVARLREQIRLEYESAERVFTNFTPTAQHKYITTRQENIAVHFDKLKKQVGLEEAMLFMMQLEVGTQSISSTEHRHLSANFQSGGSQK